MSDFCLLCKRTKEIVPITEHHLIPVVKGGAKGDTMTVCEDCHCQIHLLYNNSQLRDIFNTVDAIICNEELQKFAKFASKQTKRIPRKESNKRGLK